MKTQELTAIELFAGIGGFRLGLENANIQTIWANDINELSCKVYKSNFGKDSIVLGDIKDISLSDIPNHNLLTAGFPCQPFSPAGKKLEIRDSVRGTLFERIVQIIDAKKPQYFFLEVEYARLMGFPDDWCREARIYDQYALFGNAIVPICVEWVCKRIGRKNVEFAKSIQHKVFSNILLNSQKMFIKFRRN
jgi:site-specific DNA-cytosine methylase